MTDPTADDEAFMFDPDEPMLPEVERVSGLRGLVAFGPEEHPHATPEEMELGNRLGDAIDINDDGDVDGGLLWTPGRRTAPSAAALVAATSLKEALQDYGVKASIELQGGASGSGYGPRSFVRNLSHHTVSRPSNGMTPCLSLVKNGRSDLAGPLCNGYGGYDRVARIITLGIANHAGLGGPWSVPGWGTVPQDNGNAYAFGWEFEGGYSDSWIGPYEAMHDFMARCNAATLDWLTSLPGNAGPPAPIECQGEHKSWAPGRKVDRYEYTTSSGRATTAKVRASKNTPPKEDGFMADMSDAEKKLLLDAAHSIVYARESQEGAVEGEDPKPWFTANGLAHAAKASSLAYRIHYRQLPAVLAELAAQREVLTQVLAAVTSDPDITEEKLSALLDEKLSDAAKLVRVQVTAEDGDDPVMAAAPPEEDAPAPSQG